LNAWITLRTCDSSVRTTAAICGAGIPVDEASKIIARCRVDWYFARLEIRFNRTPSSGASSRTNTLLSDALDGDGAGVRRHVGW